MRREDLLRRFLDGVKDDEARFHVEYVKEPADIDQAVYEVVNFIETRKRSVSGDGTEKKSRKSTRAIREVESETDTEEEGKIKERVARLPGRPKGQSKIAEKSSSTEEKSTGKPSIESKDSEDISDLQTENRV